MVKQSSTIIEEIAVPGYEKVIEAKDEASGLHCFIAIHNTTMGPSLGGTRIFPYKNREEALTDALRLAQAMTYKSAVAESGMGGGKGVIICDPHEDKTKELLTAYAEVVNSLKGQYIAAEDVGSTPQDIEIIGHRTKYVAALPIEESSGDPSRFTAWGIFKGIEAVAQTLWGSPSLQDVKIALQGVGAVGSKLARLLFWHGAELYISDVMEEKVHEFAVRYGGNEVHPDDFASTECDILCPCAMGGCFNDKTIPQLRCKAIAGSANNQLLESRHGQMLMDRGILYAPDFVINSGGIINAASEFDPHGYDPKVARDRTTKIYDILMEIFEKSEREGKPTSVIADELALYKLENKIGVRKNPVVFHNHFGL